MTEADLNRMMGGGLGRAKRNMFRVSPKERRTWRGVLFASRSEMLRATELELLTRTGEVLWWIAQPKFWLGCAENVYRPDFLVVWKSGAVWVEDVKGIQTEVFKKNLRLWREFGPCDLKVMRRGRAGWKVETVEAGTRFGERLGVAGATQAAEGVA